MWIFNVKFYRRIGLFWLLGLVLFWKLKRNVTNAKIQCQIFEESTYFSYSFDENYKQKWLISHQTLVKSCHIDNSWILEDLLLKT